MKFELHTVELHRVKPTAKDGAAGLLLGLALAIVVAACTAWPGVRVVCDENGAGSDLLGPHCAAVAEAALTQVGDGRPVEVIVVFGWQGCFPGAFCGLRVAADPPGQGSAVVGVRFGDGAPSVLRSVDNIAARPPVLTEVDVGQTPDEFIDLRLATRGAWEISLALPSVP